MRDPKSPRSLRPSTTLVVGASLALFAGLGLARTVWGAPPTEDEVVAPGTEELGTEQPDAKPSGTELAALTGEDPTATADPGGLESDLTGGTELEEPEPAPAPTPAAGEFRTQMESGMAELGGLAVDARADEDLVRATCVLDKQDRANDVMDLGTSEMLVIRDPNTSDQARGFATEKLEAAAGRIEALVKEAEGCSGREGPEEEVDITRNDSEEPRTVPLWDPTAGLGDNPVPPPVDGGWPPAASPIE